LVSVSSVLGIRSLGISLDLVDKHKNINGTNKRRINNSLIYSESNLSRYVDRELQKNNKL
jgi:hypothetical protein